ncbi:MAG: UPF0182 family protein [Firmicutes bacterium]|nr:UPF0182 family protein [Bacillota bacterium]
MQEKKKKGAKVRIVLCVLILLAALIYALTGFLTDLLWFKETGYVSVFFTEIVTKIKLGIPTAVIIALLMWAFLSALKKGFLSKGGYVLEESEGKKLRKAAIGISLVLGIIVSASIISRLWWQILQFLNATDFGIADPLYGNDVGFYVFKLEFLDALSSSALSIVAALLLATVIYYALMINFVRPDGSAGDTEADTYEYDIPGEDEEESLFGGRNPFGNHPAGKIIELFTKQKRSPEPQPEPRKDLKQTGHAILRVAGTQIAILGVLGFLLLAARFVLARYDLLYSGTGVAYGAGYTDINVTLNVYRICIALAVLSAILFVLALKKRSIVMAIVCPVLMVVVFGIGTLAAGAVQSLVVAPDEINKERTYLQHNIDYTRMAYDLQDISIRDFVPQTNLSIQDVLENMGTFSNVRINDFEPAQQFYNQTQSIRTYYEFNDVDVDRYYVNGEYTQVFLSAREINQARIENQWLIRHLKYTHGYGITLSRVDKVTTSGQPDMLIDSIPPVSEVPEITISRPEIYFGESTNNYVITNTSEQEFDYPSGESNVYCTYEGTGGIKLNFFNRILFAIREQSLKMLVSTNIKSDSKILIYRNINDRVNKIAPFLMYDDDPYVVVADGHVYWMINAYTASAYYPYSEPYSTKSDLNYIRNSVKVVIDAYNGDTNFYICDEKDPVACTLSKIYPKLFKDFSEMPESLKEHVQYPNAMFSIQADVFQKYHMTDVAVFYQNEDLWDIARESYGQTEMEMTPNYFIMKLPGEQDVEFVSSIPYTPSGKNNMTGILTARSDGANYGQIILYRMPKDRIIYGPAQIEAQINQDVEISKEFSLWNNSGSTYSRGNLYVLPVEGTLLYAEPIYLEATSGSLPEVKRVIMYYGEKLAYKSTLAECLDALFGAGAGDPLNTAYPIETGRQMAEAIEKGEYTPGKPPQPQPGGDSAEPGENAGRDEYLEKAAEAYDKAMEYLQQMKEYLDMANNAPVQTPDAEEESEPIDLDIVETTEEGN